MVAFNPGTTYRANSLLASYENCMFYSLKKSPSGLLYSALCVLNKQGT